jgi:hypothetical protein
VPFSFATIVNKKPKDIIRREKTQKAVALLAQLEVIKSGIPL